MIKSLVTLRNCIERELLGVSALVLRYTRFKVEYEVWVLESEPWMVRDDASATMVLEADIV